MNGCLPVPTNVFSVALEKWEKLNNAYNLNAFYIKWANNSKNINKWLFTDMSSRIFSPRFEESILPTLIDPACNCPCHLDLDYVGIRLILKSSC